MNDGKVRLWIVSIIFVVCFLCSAEVLGQARNADAVSTCDSLSSSPAGVGARYEGTIRNLDYRFAATIPSGLVGWGASQGAPFHGFTIYLPADRKPQSCIDFSIGIHVSLPDDEGRRSRSASAVRRLKGRGWTGLENSMKGFSEGTSIENVVVTTHIRRSIPVEGRAPISETIDVGITLVTPTAERNMTEPILREFLSQLTFW
jgi:hypothetical protein